MSKRILHLRGAVRTLALAVLVAVTLSGCAVESTRTCVEWADYATAEAAATDAGLVVVGRVVGTALPGDFYGVTTPMHRIAVESVLKGELPAGTSEITVLSAPHTCNGRGEAGAFPDGDPLQTVERIEVFIYVEDGQYRTLTPTDGVRYAPDDQPLPWQPHAP